MATLVLTALGDDRPGLVDALASAVADEGGNWERAQMTRLAGKFAGIVLATVPDARVAALRDALSALAADGILDVDVVVADATPVTPAGPATVSIALTGTDRAGVVREVTHVLAVRGVSIESLETSVRDAPMGGDRIFEATASLIVPEGVTLAALREAVESAVPDYLVDVDALEA